MGAATASETHPAPRAPRTAARPIQITHSTNTFSYGTGDRLPSLSLQRWSAVLEVHGITTTRDGGALIEVSQRTLPKFTK